MTLRETLQYCRWIREQDNALTSPLQSRKRIEKETL
jgi:hypothetical protein